MALKKITDPALINEFVTGATNQVVSSSTPKSDDPNFPVFRTPLEKDLIVYFPKVCVTTVDGQEVYNPLVSHAHAVRKGAKQFLTYRCISGLSGGAYENLHYDGTCPFCDGLATCWDLYNEKMARKAAEMGIDLQNDTADTMKPYRQQFIQEMAIKKSEEYVTFPIVIISDTGTIPQSLDAAKCEAQFVTMRKDTFEQKIMDPLTKQAVPIAHPGGLFFKWCFTYDTKGKPANVRDAAKNAQYLPIVDAGGVNALSPFVPNAEAAAQKFTNAQAASCVIMNQFYDKEDLVKEVDAILADTNRTLSVLKQGAPAVAPVNALPNVGSGVAGALAAFGGGTPVAEASATAPTGAPATGFAGFGA